VLLLAARRAQWSGNSSLPDLQHATGGGQNG